MPFDGKDSMGSLAELGQPSQARPVVVFDLDRTLLQGYTIQHLANRLGFRSELRDIRGGRRPPDEGWPQDDHEVVSALFEGIEIERIEEACGEMLLRPESGEVVKELQSMGLAVGAGTEAYHPMAVRACRSLKLQFAAGVELEVEEGRLTGRLSVSPYPGPCNPWFCKKTLLEEAGDRYAAPFRVAAGDGPSDICMLEAADLGIAVERARESVRAHADVVARLSEVPDVVREHLDELAPDKTLPAPPIELPEEDPAGGG